MSQLQKEIGKAHAFVQSVYRHLRRELATLNQAWWQSRENYRNLAKKERTAAGAERYSKIVSARRATLRSITLVSEFERRSALASSHLDDARLKAFRDFAREVIETVRDYPSEFSVLLVQPIRALNSRSAEFRDAIDPTGQLFAAQDVPASAGGTALKDIPRGMSNLQNEIGQAHAAIQRFHAILKRELMEVTNLWLQRRQAYRDIPKANRTYTGVERYLRLCERRRTVLRSLALISRLGTRSSRAASHLTDARLADFAKLSRKMVLAAQVRPSKYTASLCRLVWSMSRWPAGVRSAIDPSGALFDSGAVAPVASPPIADLAAHVPMARVAWGIPPEAAHHIRELLSRWKSQPAAPSAPTLTFDQWLEKRL